MIKKTILNAVDQTLSGLPKTILRKLLSRKVREAGVEMPEHVVDALTEHLLSKQEGNFTWHDGIKEIKNLQLTFSDEDVKELDEAVTKVLAAIPEATNKAFKAVCESTYTRLVKSWPNEDAAQQYELQEFRRGMEDCWGEGLALLRMLLTCCREIGEKTARRYQKSKSVKYQFRRWVLLRLHIRACQVSDEIICLMQNGFADGAMARWRTLHEISIVATLISNGDEDLAERYILHDAVEVKRQADDYDATHVPRGISPVSKRERKSIDGEYQAVLDRFGPTFASPYGWAAKHLALKKPTFKELQTAADRMDMSSYYKIASFNVHASARSLFFNLGSMEEDVLLAGRSNAGLAEPGEHTASTLLLITGLYVGSTLNMDRLAELDVVIRIRDEIRKSFRKADRRLIREVRNASRTANELNGSASH